MNKASILLALWLPLVAIVHAQTPAPTLASAACDPSPEAPADPTAANRIRQLVREKKFSAVADELDDKLARYERGQYSDLALYWTVYAAMRGDPSEAPLLAQWVQEKPRHFMARLVKATHHIAAGYAKRGGDFANKTSVEQFAAMEAEFKLAVAELQIAMDVRPSSALPRAFLIDIARAIAGPGAVRGLLIEAEKVDPRNLSARYAAISALEPRWGGELQDLEQLVSRLAASPVPLARQRFLRYQVEMHIAGHHEVISKEKTKAMAHYREAARICPSADAHWRVAGMAYDLENWPVVIEATDAHLALRPGGARAFERRGWAKEKLGRMADAVADYERAADAGEAWSQGKLGYFLMTGTVTPKDLPRARRLLEAAAAKGNAHARSSLQWLDRQGANAPGTP